MNPSENKQKDSIQTKKRWDNYKLVPSIHQALVDLDFHKPSLVQAQSLSLSLDQSYKRMVLIIKSITGTGKTLCFVIPILQHLDLNIPLQKQIRIKDKTMQNILTSIKHQPQAIIITNGQQLSIQIRDRFKQFIQKLEPYYKQKYGRLPKIGLFDKNQKEYGNIIVSVAKSFENQKKNLNLQYLKWFTCDEADNIHHYQKDFFLVLKDFKESTKVIICSATLSKEFIAQIENIYDNKKIVNIIDITQLLRLKQKKIAMQGIKHFYYLFKQKQRETVIIQQIIIPLYQKCKVKPFIIIFFNKISQLQVFQDKMKEIAQMKNSGIIQNIKTQIMHSKIPYQQKKKIMSQMRNGQINVLLSTDSISRGIDIRNIQLIINTRAPQMMRKIDPDTFLHRVGRTGRYNDIGLSLTILCQKQVDRFINETDLISLIKQIHQIVMMQLMDVNILVKQVDIVSESKQNQKK